MFILCLGISHRTAPVALREPLAMDEAATRQALEALRTQYPHSELAILSTCNRTEFYLARPLHGHPRREELLMWLADRTAIQAEVLAPAVYQYETSRAVEHLFGVAAGMDSLVLGEYQIAHQVKRSYELAKEFGTCGSVLHRLFQSAMAAGKLVRTRTRLGEGRISIPSVAVDFAAHLFERFDDKTLLIVGAGKMAALAVQHFRQRGTAQLLICNRTAEAARDLAARHGGRAIDFADLDRALVEADMVVTLTGSPAPIITAKRFGAIRKRRKRRPLFMLDLALPRDIAPEVGRHDEVYLYDLDALQAVVEETWRLRSDELDAARRIIAEQAEQCYAQVQMGDLGQLIRRLRTHLHDIGEQEAGRIVEKLSEADRNDVERLVNEHTQRLINKILHEPLSRLTRESGAEAAMLATALRRLFELGPEEDVHPPESTVGTPKPANAQVPHTHSTDVE